MADGRQRKQADRLRKGYTDMQTHRREKPAFFRKYCILQTDRGSKQTDRKRPADGHRSQAARQGYSRCSTVHT